MNCQDIALILDDVDIGTLDGEVRHAVEDHLAGCAACDRVWSPLAQLAKMRTPELPPGFADQCAAFARTGRSGSWTTTLLALVAAGVTGVAVWAAAEQSLFRIIKGSEIPFAEAVRLYSAGVIYSYEKNAASGIRLIQITVDRTMDDATAEEFIKYMRTTIKAYEASGREAIHGSTGICSRRDEFITLHQIEKALNDIDAAVNAKLERDIQDARSILGEVRMGRFERYINTQIKKTMTVVQSDHARISESRGETPTDVLVRMCDGPSEVTQQ